MYTLHIRGQSRRKLEDPSDTAEESFKTQPLKKKKKCKHPFSTSDILILYRNGLAGPETGAELGSGGRWESSVKNDANHAKVHSFHDRDHQRSSTIREDVQRTGHRRPGDEETHYTLLHRVS